MEARDTWIPFIHLNTPLKIIIYHFNFISLFLILEWKTITFFSIAQSRGVLCSQTVGFLLHSFIPLWFYFTLHSSVSFDLSLIDISEMLAFFLMCYVSLNYSHGPFIKLKDASWFQFLIICLGKPLPMLRANHLV